MAKYCRTITLTLVLFHLGVAQRLNHSLRAQGGPHPSVSTASLRTFPDTLRVLGIMVQFQPDADPLTSGTGQFDLSTSAQKIIDAPPRDSAYFADHLRFANNYFRKASNGKENISATLLGAVLTLPKQMKQYAPIASNLSLGHLIEESWKAADSVYPSFRFQDYDLFIVFHAGSGKDIDLRGSLGYDPTPYDIPSIYFSLPGLRNLFGQTYAGVQLKNHPGFTITNSALLPETENRLLPGLTGDFLYQLAINGLVVANVASHLGLPDLFDTKTGGTAIGRFGLMDGQSIFSFSGLFPPQPSAWEKIFLGWTTPILVGAGSTLVRAPAVGMYGSGDDTVYRVPLSAKEYFLVENRNRDAKKDGETLTIRWNGQEFTKTYPQDDPYFNSSVVDSIYGTVVDVDEFDWSLPGAKDYAGGILIWHIDESTIEKNIQTNTINADPTHRGIDLEEADGSQDIGQSYGLLDAGSGTEDGSPIDFWFSKNISPVYKNEFGETTNPNSLSYSFARSHITMDQFSDAAPVMTMRVTIGDATLSLLKTVKRGSVASGNYDTPTIADVNGDGKLEFLFYDGVDVSILRQDLSPYTIYPGGFFAPSSLPPTVVENFSGNNIAMIATANGASVRLSVVDSLASGAAITVSVDSMVTTPLCGINNKIFLGTASGKVEKISTPGARTTFSAFATAVKTIALLPDENWVASNGDSVKNSFGAAISLNGKKAREIVNARLERNGSILTIVALNDGSFELYDATTLQLQYRFSTGYTGASAVSVADVDGDGTMDILVGEGSSLYAYNYRGVVLDNFPFKVLDGGSVLGSPAVVGLTGSVSRGIVFGSSSGHLYAIDSKGKILQGFPLQTGGVVSSPVIKGQFLAAASTDSSVYFYMTGSMFDTSKIFWNGYLADVAHSNFAENNGVPVLKFLDILPSSLAYNWPNPVYDRTTNIRYYLSKASSVKIKVYNMAGELVDEFAGPGYANLDNEVVWDVSKVQSGVYFAHIKATAAGEEKSVVIKIAVVK